MKEWQKQFTNKNLSKLITSIKCDAEFLAYLVEYDAISFSEMESLISLQGGETNKALALVRILQTRNGGYEHLAKALKKSPQTEAFSILLKGIQQQLIFRNVFCDGVHLPLQDVCKSIDQESLQDMIAIEVNTEIEEELLNPGSWTLTADTLPTALPYYIPRTLSINLQTDPEIFQNLENDIFCIEGHELNELSRLPKGRRNDFPDWSSNQIYELSTTLILLEHHDHFSDIAKIAERPVHWLKYSEGRYWYVKSSPGSAVKNVSTFLISKCCKTLSQEEFVEGCLNNPENEPVFIYDSPGMGKSVLLAELGRKMKKRRPENSVMYFEIAELINKVRQVDENCCFAAIKQTLVQNITVNRLGRRILGKLLDSRGHRIQLFLDGYDEVLQTNSSDANRILDNIVKEGQNIRIFVATRTHKKNELEAKFGVLGYNILPFDDCNKTDFFLKYWQSEHGVGITDGIKDFAEHCLKTVLRLMSSDESDIAGIPLQCRMLAEVHAENARKGGLLRTEQLSSIFNVYKRFINTKFSTFSSDGERQHCYDFHGRESLRTLFPEKFKHLHEDLSVHDYEPFYRIGILEPPKSGSDILTYLHRTLAEYFAAEYLANIAVTQLPMNLLESEFIELFFQEALTCCENDSKEVSFQNPVVCRFLNFFFSTRQSEARNCEAVKGVLRESSSYNSETLIKLLESSLRINAFHLYLFLLDVFLDLEEFSYESTGLLKFKQNLQDSQNWKVEGTKKLQFVIQLKEDTVGIGLLVAAAAEHSSLNLVKLSCNFLESVTGNKIHQLQYDIRKSPAYFALKRGNYQIFAYLLSFDRDGFYKQPLLHWCLHGSVYTKNVRDKVQIIKSILHERSDLLNKPHPDHYNEVPLLVDRVHFSLIKCLIEAGADLSQINSRKENIGHKAEHFSADEYHELVELLISRYANNYDGLCRLFKEQDYAGCTPVHRALQWIDLNSKTLELLANRCKVNFNSNSKPGSELATAIQFGRSARVISDIIRLGGDKEKLDEDTRKRLELIKCVKQC